MGNFATDAQTLPEDDRMPLDVNECLNDLKAALKALRAELPIDWFFSGIPDNAQVMLKYKFPVAAQLPAALTGSAVANSCYGPTASTVLTIQKKHGSDLAEDIGTLTYAQTTGVVTVAFAAAVDFVAGDYLLINNQNPKDASAQGFGARFLATRT